MTEQLTGDAALDAGRFGAPPAIERDAFTLQGQGADTAKREREISEQLRAERRAASQHDESASKSASKSRKSSSSSSSASSSSSG